MSAQRALGSSREPEEWQRGTEAARNARAVVAGQAADLLTGSDITGGRQLAGRRLNELRDAERTGDRMLVRAAAMECGVAFLAWVVRFDLAQPSDVKRSAA